MFSKLKEPIIKIVGQAFLSINQSYPDKIDFPVIKIQ